jgi:hypothetical protein
MLGTLGAVASPPRRFYGPTMGRGAWLRDV